jgi:galactokinase
MSAQKIRAYAPGRAELLGNHTDYNEGFVLAIAVQYGITVEGGARSDGIISLEAADIRRKAQFSLGDLRPSQEETWANYVLGVVSGFKERGATGPGFDLHISGNLPSGAGLSSSAALECSTARFLQQLWNTQFDDLELAKIGQAAEHHFVGVKCGLLDQMTSLFGRDHKAVFMDCRTHAVERLPVPDQATFVLVQSGAKHALVSGEYNERRAACERVAAALHKPFLRDVSLAELESARSRLADADYRRALHVVGENDRVLRAQPLLTAGDAAGLGQLMFESHESSRVNFENSCEELDLLVHLAHSAPGCHGARLSGGGFGGATINLVASTQLEAFKRAMLEGYRAHYGRDTVCLVTEAAGG